MTTETTTADHPGAGAARYAAALSRHADNIPPTKDYAWNRFVEFLQPAIHFLRSSKGADSPLRKAFMNLTSAQSYIDQHGAYYEGTIQMRQAYDRVAETRAELLRQHPNIW